MQLRYKISPELTTKLLGLLLFGIACYMGILHYFWHIGSGDKWLDFGENLQVFLQK